MAFTRFPDPTNNISNLANQPVEPPATLKQKFDQFGEDSKDWTNNMFLPELEATTNGDSGADNIGATALSGGVATTVQGIVEELDAKIDTQLPTPDGSITDAKLSNDASALKQRFSNLKFSNVYDFGALGDGVTDDTVAIQSAIDSVGTLGGLLYFPKGVFKITSSLLLKTGKKPIIIEGFGWSYDNGQATRILVDSAINAFTIQSGCNGNTFENINIYGSNVGLIGINAPFGNKTRVFNCLVERFATGILLGQGLCHVKDSYIRNCTSIGVSLYSDSWFHENEISVCGVGLKVVSGGNRIHHNLVNTNTSYGIHVDGSPVASQVSINDISNNYIGECGGFNIYIDGTAGAGQDIIVSNNYIQQVTNYASAGGIKLKNLRHVYVSGNQFYGGGLGAFRTDLESILAEGCIDLLINGFISHDSTNPIKINTCIDCKLSDIEIYSHGNSTTPAGSEYAIIITGGSRHLLNGIKIADPRALFAQSSKGISNTSSQSVLFSYYLYTPAATPNSFGTMSVFEYDINLNMFKVSSSLMQIIADLYVRDTGIFTGLNSPEGVKIAGVGSLYLRTNGGANTTLYVKESGSGNTGWIAK